MTKRICAILATGWLALAACRKPAEPSTPATSSSLGYLIANAANCTLFESALVKSNVDTILTGSGPFTVFLPNDAACHTSGLSPNDVANLSDSAARQLVLYHIVSGEGLLSTSFGGAHAQPLIMANGDSVFVTYDSSGLYVNGVSLIALDVTASNGVIHVLNQVLSAPTGSLWKTISADTSLTLFAKAVTTIGGADSLLASGGPYTLLAPVNDAFRAHSIYTEDDVDAANPDSLRNLVWNHWMNGRYFGCDLPDSTIVAARGDSSLFFLNNGLYNQVRTLNADSLATPATFLTGARMARNGVLYTVDQWITP